MPFEVSLGNWRLGRNFERLWAAAAVSNVGDGLRLAAFPLLAATITRDPLLVAGLTVALRLPWFLFSLPAGALADRFDRRRVMIFVSAAQGAAMALFGLTVLAGGANLTLLYVFAFLLGVGEVTLDTTTQTLLPATVARSDLDQANGRLIATERICNELAGPPVGSVLFASFAAAPFILDAASFVGGAALIRRIGGGFKAAAVSPQMAAEKRLLDGFRWVWSSRLFRSLTLFGVMVNLMGGAVTSVLVLVALETLGLSELGYGLLLAGLAAGGLAGALLAPRARARFGPGPLFLGSAVLQSIGYAMAGLLSNPVAVGLALAVVQAGLFATLVVFFSVRQAIVPDHVLGRVTAAMRLIAAGALPLGAALGGVVANVFGLRAPFLVAAVGLAVAVVAGAPNISNANIVGALDETS